VPASRSLNMCSGGASNPDRSRGGHASWSGLSRTGSALDRRDGPGLRSWTAWSITGSARNRSPRRSTSGWWPEGNRSRSWSLWAPSGRPSIRATPSGSDRAIRPIHRSPGPGSAARAYFRDQRPRLQDGQARNPEPAQLAKPHVCRQSGRHPLARYDRSWSRQSDRVGCLIRAWTLVHGEH
jgi:hypothetical protein